MRQSLFYRSLKTAIVFLARQFPPGTFSITMCSLHYPKFVEETILELLHSYRMVEVQAPPYVVNPLSVSVQPNGKKRLILGLRYVNEHLIKQRVEYKDWKIALSYFQKGAFMISFDLKSGYHHIVICPDHQTFLGFAWKFSGDTKYLLFCLLD